MSRVGKYPVELKDNTTVSLKGDELLVRGKKGESSIRIPDCIKVVCENNLVSVSMDKETTEAKRLWGSLRSLLNNMVIGVSNGFKETLDINGVGYRASVQGKNLVLQLGFSHDVIFPIPSGVSIVCPDQTHINIEGIDKQLVGQVAAKIRGFKKPEPYKGKGIKYSSEVILRKEGKKK